MGKEMGIEKLAEAVKADSKLFAAYNENLRNDSKAEAEQIVKEMMQKSIAIGQERHLKYMTSNIFRTGFYNLKKKYYIKLMISLFCSIILVHRSKSRYY